MSLSDALFSSDLFSSDLWKPALEKYAGVTRTTVKLFDTHLRTVFGPIHPTPLFQVFDEIGFDPGIFAECANRCLIQTQDRPAVTVSKAHGLAVIGTSLVLEGKVVGAAVAGYVLLDFSQVSEIQHMAREAGLGFERLWRVAREQKPMPQGRLTVTGELLQVLGDTLLRENYRTRQYEKSAAILEHIVEQRTAVLRDLSSKLMRSQDDERRRISRELHDSVGQYLAHAKMSLTALKRPDATEKETKSFLQMMDDLDRCLVETRTISHLLHPPLLDEVGFASAAKWYVDGFSERSSIQVNLDIPDGMKRLPGALELVLFRILQESLTNIHRHSHSQSADIQLELDGAQVKLEVRDHGKGMSPQLLKQFRSDGTGSGVGLRSMRERISELGGRLDIQSDTNGTLIEVTAPLPA